MDLTSSTAIKAALVKSEVNNTAVEITFLQFMLVEKKKISCNEVSPLACGVKFRGQVQGWNRGLL